MTITTRLLLAASLALAPLGWAAAQDQPRDDQQHPRDRQERQEHKPQQQQQQQQHTQPGNAAPLGQQQHTGPGTGAGGQQHPAQNNSAPPATQSIQRSAPPSPPPIGATASPTPPPGQFERHQGPPPNRSGGAPAATAQQTPQPQAPQQQQQQQRFGQRGVTPGGQAAPQGQAQPQQRNTTRNNFQGSGRTGSTANFVQHHEGARPEQFDRGRFYGHDYGHFTVRERDLWHRGSWHHEFHDGRFGWWYAVDGIWYFYDAPVYPYPTFVPEIVYIPEEEYYGDAIDAEPAYAPAPPQYGQPPAYYYYFCPDTRTYYPYVSSCASPWQPVPAAPPQ